VVETTVVDQPGGTSVRGGRRRTSRRQAAFDALLELDGDPLAAAHSAGLRYVSDQAPGIGRRKTRGGFRYVDADGAPVRDDRTLQRIAALAIPPAWTDVWICPSPRGHLQATGRDARGRKQYRYHPRWREVRDETKYAHLVAFARALPCLRRRVAADLARPGLAKEKVVAAVVRLLETTLIRVGSDEYARTNDSYGLTTMRDEHVEVEGAQLRFAFQGKSGVEHEVDLRDRRLAGIVRRCQDLPGQDLFQYRNGDGTTHRVTSDDVNAYLHEATGEAFTAKDFRTWAGTVLAAQALAEFGAVDTEAEANRNVVAAIEAVAKRLGNTRPVCRACYVHPAVIDAYLDGTLAATLCDSISDELAEVLPDLPPEEAAVLALLHAGPAAGPRRRA
jgi:DNA topoisomerase I